MISFDQAYKTTIEKIKPLDEEHVTLWEAEGRVTARELLSKVWSPSLDVSLKDGYAIQSEDIQNASPERGISLTVVGSIAAGGDWNGILQPGQAVRILSGAPIPAGAQAVIAKEFTRQDSGQLLVYNNAEPGRNVLEKGEDVKKDEFLLGKGALLTPGRIGYLASAGYEEIPVIRSPRVGIIATGDEVVAPGNTLPEGKLYASNLVTLGSWCNKFGFSIETDILPDEEEALWKGLSNALEMYDAVITSGGAWTGDKDLVKRVLVELGWKMEYHHIRMGPGKAVGFGMVGMKPVFILPGGPPSNHIAFLQLGLPGLKRLAGWIDPGMPFVPVVMSDTIRGQIDWTQVIHGKLTKIGETITFKPIKPKSRLQMISTSDAIVMIPEGINEITQGAITEALLLN
ncbi:MAG: molybdopterin molybdotransferase MoeA [Anaerolineales bacterium]|nr:molybdopterin molybdotransferase MoeA [Anaerolineales bacterium]